MYKLGQFELHIVSDGRFRLDGGAMFGIVPKALWSRCAAPDESNRIPMSLTCLLVKTPKRNILIECGIGEKYDAEWLERYQIEHVQSLPQSLHRAGVEPRDIDWVIPSHLHFDHAGGATRRNESGQPVATFPRARYLIQKAEWAEAMQPNERTRGSYLADDFMPLFKAQQVDFVEGGFEVEKGIRIERTGGHTEGHQVVWLESEGQKAVYLADVVPMTPHVRLAYIAGFDLYPLETLAVKKRILANAEQTHALCIWVHDPEIAMGFLKKTEKGYAVNVVEKVSDR